MKRIKTDIGFTTDPCMQIDSIIIDFTKKDIDKIKEIADLVKSHGLESAKVDVGEVLLLEDGEESQYKKDGLSFIVFEWAIYLCGQNKYDATSQFESSQIMIKSLT